MIFPLVPLIFHSQFWGKEPTKFSLRRARACRFLHAHAHADNAPFYARAHVMASFSVCPYMKIYRRNLRREKNDRLSVHTSYIVWRSHTLSQVSKPKYSHAVREKAGFEATARAHRLLCRSEMQAINY